MGVKQNIDSQSLNMKPMEIIKEVRKMRICLLARPKYLFTVPKGPNYKEICTRPTKAALVYKATPRIKYLSKQIPRKVSPKYKPLEKPAHYVTRESLYYTASDRLIELATPVSVYRDARRSSERSKKVQMKNKFKATLYEKFRPAWLKLRAGPKKPPEPHYHVDDIASVCVKGANIYIKCKLKDKCPCVRASMEAYKIHGGPSYVRLSALARPTKIRPKYEPSQIVDMFKENRERDLNTQLTKRLRDLYLPRQLKEEALLDMNFQPFTVSKAALKYVASPRIEELAQHIERAIKEDEDYAQDAFTVPRRALRAICSKRTAELAIPVKRE